MVVSGVAVSTLRSLPSCFPLRQKQANEKASASKYITRTRAFPRAVVCAEFVYQYNPFANIGFYAPSSTAKKLFLNNNPAQGRERNKTISTLCSQIQSLRAGRQSRERMRTVQHQAAGKGGEVEGQSKLSRMQAVMHVTFKHFAFFNNIACMR